MKRRDMPPPTKLFIRLTRGTLRPQWGHDYDNEFHGGPETLLAWLETQLGLPPTACHHADRITEYANVLDSLGPSSISASMETDRWATASELLSRRDELLLAGWDEREASGLPKIARDLAQATDGKKLVFPSEAERLQKILGAFDAGQTLPAHDCCLTDLPEAWPTVWRDLFQYLDLSIFAEFEPAAPNGSALLTAQTSLGGGDSKPITPDESFRYAHTRSQSPAVEFVVGILASSTDLMADTVICCEDDDLAIRLDACLHRIGLPTTGASISTRAHPVLQVLPLAMALCWEPVDPQALLDFLTLPLIPLPRKAAARLAAALIKEPGLGSRSWEAAVIELCSIENDPERKLRDRLDAWLLCERTPLGTDIPTRILRSRCGLVSQWAAGRAIAMAKDENPNPKLINALQTAARQASLLGELAESQGTQLSEPQLARLLEEALASGVTTTACLEADGGPIRVQSLAEIAGPCKRLVWLGVGTGDARGCRWSTHQLRELADAGIEIDDGSKALASLRSAEIRGFQFVSQAFLAVLLPQDLEKRWHPIWLTIREQLSERGSHHPPVFEDLVAANSTDELAPFTFESCETTIEPPQPQRLAWDIPYELLKDRDSVSASELQTRLGCPLKWTFNYQARLRPSSIAELPSDFLLKGSFCHSLLEQVFGDGKPTPSVDEAVAQITFAFDERLPLDAAPLAQPNKYFERQQLRSQMENATRVLIETLTAGGYRIVGIEVELDSQAFDKSLVGWVDCVVAKEDGSEAIIDFKYGGRSKYHSLIEKGEAVQLATYAYGRRNKDGAFPAVAYLILSDGLLYTPSASPLEGGNHRSMIDAPAIQSVWQHFFDAVNNADDWRTTNDLVPARPLQNSTAWPPGATIVLDEKIKESDFQAVCQYCNFKRLCGVQETN